MKAVAVAMGLVLLLIAAAVISVGTDKRAKRVDTDTMVCCSCADCGVVHDATFAEILADEGSEGLVETEANYVSSSDLVAQNSPESGLVLKLPQYSRDMGTYDSDLANSMELNHRDPREISKAVFNVGVRS